jgi:rubrerythrin
VQLPEIRQPRGGWRLFTLNIGGVMATKIDSAKTIFIKALQMEEKGKEFYEKALAKTKNKFGKEIFMQLINSEKEHVDRIKRICEDIENGVCWYEQPEFKKAKHKDIQDIFRKLAVKLGKNIKPGSSALEALSLGVDLENRSIKFYQEELLAATDEHERDFLGYMIIEERSHYAALSDIQLYLKDPEAWFQEHEHAAYDGA